MAGIRALQMIQFGIETTPGTALAATVLWRGVGTLNDEAKPVAIKEQAGYLFSLGRVAIPKVGAVLKLDATPATFEQLPYLLAAGVENTTTGTADGAGSGKIYQYDAPTITANSIKSLTARVGDNQRVDVMAYTFTESFHLKGAKGGMVEVDAELRGRQAVDGDFTTGVTPAAAEPVLFQLGKLYLNADGGTIGTTQVTGSLLGFEFGGRTGWNALWTADGQVYFTQPVYVGNNADTGGQEVTGKLVLLHDANAETELAKARSGEIRLMRLLFQGSALTTAGTTYTHKTLQIDAAIQYTDIPDLGEQDNLGVMEFPFRVVLNAARNLSYQIIVVNEVATL
jgi:hypothetical protein